MSITVNNIISPNIIRLQNIVTSQSYQLQQLIDLYSDKNKRSYDQTTKQNVIISFNQSTQRYRFEIEDQENDVFMYQIWKKDNSTLNSDRKYVYISLKSWINEFKAQLNFTPTTLIEINNIFYPTVMVDAVIEQNKCVFYFDSRSIKGSNVLLLPKNGRYNNVRFDIDSVENNMQNLIDLMITPIIKSLNIQTESIPVTIPTISKSVNQSGGLFVMNVSVSDFSVFINNIQNLKINFQRYYGTRYLGFTITLSCYINIGSLNFTGIRCLAESYEDANFTNVKIPFDLNVYLKFDRADISKSTVTLSLPQDSIIVFDQSMTNFWNDYWGYRINVARDASIAADAVAAASLGIATAAAVYYNALWYALGQVNDQFMGTLNSEANFKTQVSSQLVKIEPLINSYLNSPTVLNLYNNYKYLIDIVFQPNISQWNMSDVVNENQNYIYTITDTPFQGTNFPPNQVYIVKSSDFSSCYAVNMERSVLNEYPFNRQTINISGYEPAAVLLKTSDEYGTIVLANTFNYGFYVDSSLYVIINSSSEYVRRGNFIDYWEGTVTKNEGVYIEFEITYTTQNNNVINPIIHKYKFIDTRTLIEIDTNTTLITTFPT